MGNSITAGFQSAGINDSTQLQSYAVLFAQQAGAPFFVPLLNKPGCPAPFAINSTNPPTRLDGAASSDCSLRNPAPLPYVSNVAVPGVTSFGVGDNTSPFGGTNQLTQFILGGRTQVKAMLDAQPTFVSVWIGNNDVVGSLTNSGNPGNPALVTPEPAFEANYGPILDSIERVGAKAVLVSVGDVASIPFSTPGAVYWCLSPNKPACPGVPKALPPGLDVQDNCAPAPVANGDSVLVPWTVGVPKVVAAFTGSATLDCSVDNEVVLPAEFKRLRDAVAGYNTYISDQAQQRGWAYVDLNPALGAAKAEAPVAGQLPKIAAFPCLPGGPCGGTTNATANILFGTYYSLDGVHPSGAAHRVLADLVIAAVNQTYGTTIPAVGP
jgi:GDSL-like lipase/acylhydrolase family protein